MKFNSIYERIILQSLQYDQFQKQAWQLISIMFQKHGQQIMRHVLQDIESRDDVGTISWGQLADIIQYNTIGDPPLVDGQCDYSIWVDDQKLAQRVKYIIENQPEDYDGWSSNDIEQEAERVIMSLPFNVVQYLYKKDIQVY